VVGAGSGLAANVIWPEDNPEARANLVSFTQNVAEPIGRIFLRLIFMVVIPLVFTALVLGVAGSPLKRRCAFLPIPVTPTPTVHPRRRFLTGSGLSP
jgi:Na+/H+-dicarboxylate symporter